MVLMIRQHITNHFNNDNGLEAMSPRLATGTQASTTRKKPHSPGKSILYIIYGGSYHVDSSLPYPILQFTTVLLQLCLGPRPPSPDSGFF
jgi:hypothetical protein